MKIDGKEIATKIYSDLKKRVGELAKKNITPCLAILIVGNDPASEIYVKQKKLTAEKIGIQTSLYQYPDSVSTKDLLLRLNDLNHLTSVHGIIVQRPFPKHLNTDVLSEAIDPKKDVDGFHPNSKFLPPIALAVLRILKEVYWKKSEARNPKSETNSNNQNTKIQNRFLSFEHSNFDIVSSFDIRISNFITWLSSQKIVVIGKGETGGRPIIQLFKQMNIKPQVIDSKTENPSAITKNADIIISAVGKPNVIKPEMIKKNSILISIGLSKGKDGKLHGDYNEEKIKNIASFYTPTPGGVGPLNVAMLLKNLVKATENQSSQVST